MTAIKTPTDTERLDWVLSFAGGDDTPLADKRTMLLAMQLMVGLDGRAAVDAAMANDWAAK